MAKAQMMVVDFETTGLKNENNSAISIGIAWVNGSEIVDTYYSLVKPYNENDPYSPQAEAVHGIPKSKAEKEGKEAKELMKEIKALIKKNGKGVFVAHNWTFDLFWLEQLCHVTGMNLEDFIKHEKCFGGEKRPCCLDSQWIAQLGMNRSNRVSLSDFTQHYGISDTDHHNAEADVKMTFSAMKAATSQSTGTVEESYLRKSGIILEF